MHQHSAPSVRNDTKSYVGISERPESADATKPPTSLYSSMVHLNEKALTKPRSRMHASGKFGGTSSLEETSSSSQSRKKLTANPDISSTSSLIFDYPETQILPK
ncbi:hypothetical protein ACFX15_012444 [Malus domestica]